jgi:hypothetical protein
VAIILEQINGNMNYKYEGLKNDLNYTPREYFIGKKSAYYKKRSKVKKRKKGR